jgi:hypothetical protein
MYAPVDDQVADDAEEDECSAQTDVRTMGRCGKGEKAPSTRE